MEHGARGGESFGARYGSRASANTWGHGAWDGGQTMPREWAEFRRRWGQRGFGGECLPLGTAPRSGPWGRRGGASRPALRLAGARASKGPTPHASQMPAPLSPEPAG